MNFHNQKANQVRSESQVRSDSQPTRFQLDPTFPIDSDELWALREVLISASKRLVIWRFLAKLGRQISFLSAFTQSWARKEQEISSVVLEHAVKRSNARQDESISKLISRLDGSRCRLYAKTLREFLHLKRRIEMTLRKNPQRAEIESLLDSVIQEVCNELILLTQTQADVADSLICTQTPSAELRQQVAASENRIRQAYATLMETERQANHQLVEPNLDVEKRQPEELDLETSQPLELDMLLENLRETNEISKKVNERMDAEMLDASLAVSS